jgi:hypothetical protein
MVRAYPFRFIEIHQKSDILKGEDKRNSRPYKL